MSEIPKVLPLAAVAPSPESVRAPQLSYNKLGQAAAKHAAFELQRQTQFFDSEPDSLDEEASAKQLALQYMLQTADRLNTTDTPDSKQLWSDRFTQATSEIFGTPDAELAKQVGESTGALLVQKARAQGVDSQLIDNFTQLAENYQLNLNDSEQGLELFKDAASEIRKVFLERYKSVYDALDIDEQGERITASQLADKFEQGFAALAKDHDEEWSQWRVERTDGKNTISAFPAQRKISIGMDRSSVSPIEAKGLFTHEVLVHCMRGFNGSRLSKELGTGLAGYLDSEEGLGVFAEYAVTGKVPSKIMNRYTDISLALGDIDGVPKTRQQIMEFASARALLENAVSESKQSHEDVLQDVAPYVNRIYRGSLGNEYIGVFTKDIAYLQGFIDIGQYIQQQLAAGQSAEQLLDMLLEAKINPTDQRHLDVIARAKASASV
jgi:hypothetical protein